MPHKHIRKVAAGHATHPFERELSVPKEDLSLELRGFSLVEWADFWLNPRRLRGSDFLMRWSQGVWSEKRLTDAVNSTEEFFALPYGPSGTAPTGDVRAFELYFERLENAGLGNLKRPDLLLFKTGDKPETDNFLSKMGGVAELPFIPEDHLKPLLSKALLAIECENSLWVAGKMPGFGAALKPQKRLGGKPGLSKTTVLPTIIIKDEDRSPLKKWQAEAGVPIHIWHVFYDRAFGIGLDAAEKLVADGLILPTEQLFQAPGGATTRKAIFKFYYHYAYPLGEAQEPPTLVPDFIEDKNGHILPYIKFEGGSLAFNRETVEFLKQL